MKLIKYYLDKGFDILIQRDDEEDVSITVSKDGKTGTSIMNASDGITEIDLVKLTRNAVHNYHD